MPGACQPVYHSRSVPPEWADCDSWSGEWRAARLEFEFESDGPSSRSDVESKHSGYAMGYAGRVSYRFL